jgi:hypothetical protein
MKKILLSILVSFLLYIGQVALLSAQTSDNKSVTYKLAQAVAEHYANSRWDGARIGEGQLYVAPDGTPEVYFFLVFKKGTSVKTERELLNEVGELRNQRVEIEKTLENTSESPEKTKRKVVHTIWSQMSAADKYGTVVVGAHEGREPFVASYNGLPPHILLREDAIETARVKLSRAGPKEIRCIWQPPLFIAFEISEEGKELESVFLEARGTKLRQIKTPRWERPELQDKVLQIRKQKWQSWREVLSEN